MAANPSNLAPVPQRALQTRQEFGSTSHQLAVQETASALVAAQAKATVEARYVMALQRPRQWDQVRQRMSDGRKGKGRAPKSAEHRAKIAAALRARKVGASC